MNSNFAFLKTRNCFQFRVKELFEPIFLQKKATGFWLCKRKNKKNKKTKTKTKQNKTKQNKKQQQQQKNIGDFTVKNAKLGKEICI